MNKSSKSEKTADKILITALQTAETVGWNDQLVATLKSDDRVGLIAMTQHFPNGLYDLTLHFADYIDRQMLAAIEANNEFQDLKIREKITFGVRARLEAIAPYKKTFAEMVRYMAHPLRVLTIKRFAWQTADKIWRAAGDTATDYNHYTKRLLLSGVLGSTTVYYLQDDSENHEKTWGFLDRRIENVMQFGKMVGKLKRAS